MTAMIPRANGPRIGMNSMERLKLFCSWVSDWRISARCWWVKGLYIDTLLLRHEKWLVAEGFTPAPVEPVMAVTWMSELSSRFLARGSSPSWMAVAKHPGLATFTAPRTMRLRLSSGSP